MKKQKTIAALFCFPGVAASARLVGVFGDRYAERRIWPTLIRVDPEK